MVWGTASNSFALGKEYDIRNTAIAQLDLIGCRQLAEMIKQLIFFFLVTTHIQVLSVCFCLWYLSETWNAFDIIFQGVFAALLNVEFLLFGYIILINCSKRSNIFNEYSCH